ncbi:hypothetical protein [Rhizobacter sp. Root1221]|uniref:hypothetical protein n=1 Tax=Rhizobacter sp. Root1221 TaxID=1736433 RepID=UPI0006FD603C|nr:hypothetical protein [Rhizobacter sp. Root1221]KQV85529.1 hypothetical protein ASC87_07545 [Rhizobacter sp. Root1221]
MFYAISWFLVFGLLALWSLGAWAFHSIATWAFANAGILAGGSPTGTLRLPDWIAPWVPPELAQALTSTLSALTPAIQGLVDWMPTLGSGLSVVVWVVWGFGSALLIGLGLVLSGVIAVLRRRASAGSSRRLAAGTAR